MPKKDFTKGDNAVGGFFKKSGTANSTPDTATGEENVKHTKYTNVLNNTNDTNNANITNNTNNAKITNDTNVTNITNITNITNVKNKSKHFDQRGPRNERVGLLMDKQLKDDLTIMAKISDSKSVNDLIVTVLLDYVSGADVGEKLEQYRKLF